MSSRKLKGFTLIELILFIALAGILALGFVFVFDIGTIPFESAIDKLKHDIRHAQWESMNRKIRHGIIFDSVSNTYSVYQNTSDNIIPDPLNPAENFTVNYSNDSMFRGVQIQSVDINGTNVIEFDGLGFPYDGNGAILIEAGTIILTHNGTNVTVSIEPNTGRVSN